MSLSTVEVEVMYHWMPNGGLKDFSSNQNCSVLEAEVPKSMPKSGDRDVGISSRPDISGLGDGPLKEVSSDASGISKIDGLSSLPNSGSEEEDYAPKELDLVGMEFVNAEQSAHESEFSGGMEEFSSMKTMPVLAKGSVAGSDLLKLECCEFGSQSTVFGMDDGPPAAESSDTPGTSTVDNLVSNLDTQVAGTLPGSHEVPPGSFRNTLWMALQLI
ncbi:hypothetical protein Nepgr_003977 [Nepenthes gracilis]|uniref:Uncharacterized protein n=1 Tax=Nepenthes gracilis TaxID=150966 RepID=A0AAD3S0H4_NEPGR|nr:hypothetical protein Nepgr_003977 [Nepenthes gracilis]